MKILLYTLLLGLLSIYTKQDIDTKLPTGYKCNEIISNDSTLFIQIKCPNGESKGYGIPDSIKSKSLQEIANYVMDKINE